MKTKNQEHPKNKWQRLGSRQLLCLLLGFMALTSFAQNESARVAHFNVVGKLALQGYDPVAYFKQGKAVKGKKELTATYQGITYAFSIPVNREYYLRNPLKYEPQFGGWCAYAMGNSGEKVEINPDTFKIVSGKLYLFYNAFLNNTLKSWNREEAALKSKAEANWKKTIK